MKKALVAGCSFTQHASWPKILLPDYEIINLGQSGAGNEYIAKSIIDFVCRNHVDFVFILWSGLRRVDVSFSKQTKQEFEKFFFQGSTTHSTVLFSGGDWTREDKNDPDLLWPHPLIDKFFKLKYHNKDQDFLIEQSSLWIMLCQSFLENNCTDYRFSFIYNPFNPPLDEPSLGRANKKQYYFTKLDWKKYIDTTPLEYAIRNDGLDTDQFHPKNESMTQWAQYIRPFMEKQ